MKKLLIVLTMMISSSSFADQCALVSEAMAIEAVELILNADQVQYFCEPCAQRYPINLNTDVVKVVADSVDGLSEVVVGERHIDLAYTYINGMNLSKLVGCESFNVSEEIW